MSVWVCLFCLHEFVCACACVHAPHFTRSPPPALPLLLLCRGDSVKDPEAFIKTVFQFRSGNTTYRPPSSQLL